MQMKNNILHLHVTFCNLRFSSVSWNSRSVATIHMINLDLWIIFWACQEFLTSWGIFLVLHKVQHWNNHEHLPGYLLRETYAYPLLWSQLEIRPFFLSLSILRSWWMLWVCRVALKPSGHPQQTFWLSEHTQPFPSSGWGRMQSRALGCSSESWIPAASFLHWCGAKLGASYPDWGLQSAWVIEILNNNVINDFVKALLCVQEYW